jgi:short-subunit dehydrogenase
MLQKLYTLDIGILVNNVGTSLVQKYEEYTHK